MATVLNRSESIAQKVILRDISWETYQRLLTEHGERTGTRFVYDRGMLEIIIVSLKHEALKDIVIGLFTIIADGRGMDYMKAGSTTFRREDLARGFEPDSCFYITHAALMRGKNEVDLAVDPSPDLVIEIDITHPSLPRFPIFAAVGIPEVWRYDGAKLSFHQLDRKTGAYRDSTESAALPGVTSEVLSRFVEVGLAQKRHEWLQGVRAWMEEAGCR
jgi:Uma2 family endonuclease